MKKVIIASLNPTKINSVKNAFEKVFPTEDFSFEGVATNSGVSDQPMTDEETLVGATNRVENIMKSKPDADFWVGLEGGIEKQNYQYAVFSWTVIKSKNMQGKSRSGSFFLPSKVTELIDNENYSLGKAIDIVFNQNHTSVKNGSVGLLTKDLITRTNLQEFATILALIPFVNSDLY